MKKAASIKIASLVFIFVAFLLVGIFFRGEKNNMAYGELAYEYLLDYTDVFGTDDFPLLAKITGTSCKDIRGKIYSPRNENSPVYEGSFSCFPDIGEDIVSYLSRNKGGRLDIDNATIDFQDGPVLFASSIEFQNKSYFPTFERDEPLERPHAIPNNARWLSGIDTHGKYILVKEIWQCTENRSGLCAKLDIYDLVRFAGNDIRQVIPSIDLKYRVYCGGCDQSNLTALDVQRMLLFLRNDFNGSLVLTNGYAVREENIEGFLSQFKTKINLMPKNTGVKKND